MKLLFSFILLFSSFSVFADSYPGSAVQCNNTWAGVLFSMSNPVPSTRTFVLTAPTTCTMYQTSNMAYLGQASTTYYGYSYCYSGGTISGSTCINAPACVTPLIRSSVTPYACFTPKECVYPESDNGSGICANNTCPTGQNRNPITDQCQTFPTCGSTQLYDVRSNTCYHSPLACPGHTHASTANDACLNDPALACPTGQHDDGTWNCTADIPTACDGATSQAGYINGQYQCIKKPNTDQKQADSVTAATAASAAETANSAAAATAKTSTDAYQAAVAALAADPTNTTKQAAAQNALGAMTDSNAAATASKATADAAKAAADDANAKAANGLLNSIDKNITALEAGSGNAFTLQTAGVFSDSTVSTAVTQAQADFNTQFQSISSQVQSLFTFSYSGSGTLPSFDYGTIFGVHVVANLNNYAVPLSYVGLTVMFLAAYISVRIFLE